MDLGLFSSLVSLMLQAAGVTLLAVLSLFLTRSVKRRYLAYWALGWACLGAALSALFVSLRIHGIPRETESLYYLGEYGFCFLLFAGCRDYASGRGVSRRDLWLLPPALGLALVIPRTAAVFTRRFLPQCVILAVAYALALWRLRTAPGAEAPLPGLRIVRAALAVLCLDFVQYAVVFGYAEWHHSILPLGYRSYTSLYDLILQVLLGFGMVTLVLQDVNRDLQIALDRIEALSRLDPLTSSLNRHAFDSFVASKLGSGQGLGCVALVDVDDLKVLNDTRGHAAGDAAIRAVAGAIRSVVRADDLVFRWGGDEFLVLLPNVTVEEASRRMAALDGKLAAASILGPRGSAPLTVSYGLAPFGAGTPLERAIEAADAAMYVFKQGRKSRPGA